LDDGRTASGRPGIPATKLKPAVTRARTIPARIAGLMVPQPGCLLLLHAAAGYGKTTALAATQQPEWLWYNLDCRDSCPLTLAGRLCQALEVTPPDPELPALGEVVAADLAHRLQGRTLTITLDRYERLGDGAEVGRLLGELLVLVPGLSLRIATRTRPGLPLERLRLEDCLREVGPGELRLDREDIAAVLTEAWSRPAEPAELDFADSVLCGWPAAIRLWRAELEEGSGDLMGPVQPGRPLHDYLHEELLVGTLPAESMTRLRAELSWLSSEGPLLQQAPTQERRSVIDLLVRDRVGVVPGRDGWQLHPLVGAFLAMHARAREDGPGEPGHRPDPHAPVGPAARRRVAIQALGPLVVRVDGLAVPEASWPTAARRLLELLLCLPDNYATAQQAARLLWPRHLLRSALNSFNVALHGLRRLLEPELTAGADSRYVVRQGRMYRLRVEEVDCDALEFARLAQLAPAPLDAGGAAFLETAVELYLGDFLASSTEEFAQEKRSRLRSIMLESLERLGEWHRVGERIPEALRTFTRLLELAPDREDAWARLLELHLASGDEYRALAALQHCEQSLRTAGIEPGGLLRELHHRIRRDAVSAHLS